MKKAFCVISCILMLTLISACKDKNYEEGVQAYLNGEYTKAIELFEKVTPGHENVEQYIELAKDGQQYETFDANFRAFHVNYMEEEPWTATSQIDAEYIVHNAFCRDWYRDGEERRLMIDEKTLDGRRYCLRAMGDYYGDAYLMVFYYADEPDALYCAMLYPWITDTAYTYALEIFPYGNDFAQEPTAMSRTWAEIQELQEEAQRELDEWNEQQRQRYSDEFVSQKLLDIMRRELSDGSASSIVTLYKFSSFKLEYTAWTKTYNVTATLRRTVGISSPAVYRVEAEFQDTGEGLELTDLYYFRTA